MLNPNSTQTWPFIVKTKPLNYLYRDLKACWKYQLVGFEKHVINKLICVQMSDGRIIMTVEFGLLYQFEIFCITFWFKTIKKPANYASLRINFELYPKLIKKTKVNKFKKGIFHADMILRKPFSGNRQYPDVQYSTFAIK